MFDNCTYKCAIAASRVRVENEGYRPSHTQEKHMNTYYISGKAYYNERYVVEAENEDEAKQEVEWGNVDCDDRELDYVDDLEVVDVEYGDVERYGKLGVTFVTRGEVHEENVRDALYTLLQQFDGKTAGYGEAELELVGFSVDHVDEV